MEGITEMGPGNQDVETLVKLELARNPKLRALIDGHEQLSEEEKAVFRLAVGYRRDTKSTGAPPRTDRTPQTGRRLVQPLVRSLMETLLENHPTLLDESDISNLMNREYCKLHLRLRMGNLALLRSTEHGTDISGHGRYWTKAYAGKYHVCNNWWKKDHLDNARSLLRFVARLAERAPRHPGTPALERHQRALHDYIGYHQSSDDEQGTT